MPTAWRLSRFEYLEKEPIETEYGVAGIAESKQREYEPTHKKLLVLGISLCIVSVLPLLMSLAAEHEFLTDCAIACIFPLVALGVNLLVRAGSIWESYQKLLEEEDYTREKRRRKTKRALCSALLEPGADRLPGPQLYYHALGFHVDCLAGSRRYFLAPPWH